MAQNINHVVLTGNLTRDPETKGTSGTSVCRLRLAVNGRRKDQQSGEWQDDPNFFDVTCFGAQAENVTKFLKKGSPVAVDGRLEWREWTADDGSRRSAVGVIANTIQFLGSSDGSRTSGSSSGGSSGGRSDFGGDEWHRPSSSGADDDIPF